MRVGPCHYFFLMKTGKRSSWPSTYYFNIPYLGDTTLDRLKKLESNKKIRNLVAMLKQERCYGWITSQKKVLGNCFQMWLDCRLKDLVPNYNISEEFLRRKCEESNCLVGKVTGTPVKSNLEWEAVTADMIDEVWEEKEEMPEFSVDEPLMKRKGSIPFVPASDPESDSEVGIEVEPGIFVNRIGEKIPQMLYALRDSGKLQMTNNEIDHYVQYCHSHDYDVFNWKIYISIMYKLLNKKEVTEDELEWLEGCPANFTRA